MERADYEKIIEKCPYFELKKNLKDKQIKNILKYIAKDIKENDIIAFYDNALLAKKGKTGILITKDALYYDFMHTKINFKGLMDIQMEEGSDFVCCYEDGHRENCFIAYSGLKELVKALMEIGERYNKRESLAETERKMPAVEKAEQKAVKTMPADEMSEQKSVIKKEATMAAKGKEKTVVMSKTDSVSVDKLGSLIFKPGRTPSDLEKKLFQIYMESGKARADEEDVYWMLVELADEADDSCIFDEDYEGAIAKYEILLAFGRKENLVGIANAYYDCKKYDEAYCYAKNAVDEGVKNAKKVLMKIEKVLDVKPAPTPVKREEPKPAPTPMKREEPKPAPIPVKREEPKPAPAPVKVEQPKPSAKLPADMKGEVEELIRKLNRTPSETEVQLLKIYRESGCTRVKEDEISWMMEDLYDEADEAYFEGEDEAFFAKHGLLFLLGKEESIWAMIESYYYNNRHEEVVKWADKYGLSHISGEGKGQGLYFIAYSYYQCKRFEEALEYAKLALKEGDEEAANLVEEIEMDYEYELFKLSNPQTRKTEEAKPAPMPVKTEEPKPAPVPVKAEEPKPVPAPVKTTLSKGNMADDLRKLAESRGTDFELTTAEKASLREWAALIEKNGLYKEDITRLCYGDIMKKTPGEIIEGFIEAADKGDERAQVYVSAAYTRLDNVEKALKYLPESSVEDGKIAQEEAFDYIYECVMKRGYRPDKRYMDKLNRWVDGVTERLDYLSTEIPTLFLGKEKLKKSDYLAWIKKTQKFQTRQALYHYMQDFRRYGDDKSGKERYDFLKHLASYYPEIENDAEGRKLLRATTDYSQNGYDLGVLIDKHEKMREGKACLDKGMSAMKQKKYRDAYVCFRAGVDRMTKREYFRSSLEELLSYPGAKPLFLQLMNQLMAAYHEIIKTDPKFDGMNSEELEAYKVIADDLTAEMQYHVAVICEKKERSSYGEWIKRAAKRGHREAIRILSEAEKERNKRDKGHIVISDECILCMGCVRMCPKGVFVLNGKKELQKPNVDMRKCIRCEACMDMCPVEAISFEL